MEVNEKKKTEKDERSSLQRNFKQKQQQQEQKNNKNKTNVYILGDSMVKKLNGYLLTKKIRH